MTRDALACYHEAGHAVVASCCYGLSVAEVKVHPAGGGTCAIEDWLTEASTDPAACLIYLSAGGAAEARATGRPAVGDAWDRVQALALASYMHDNAPATDPKVTAALRAADAIANARMQIAALWRAVEHVQAALKHRGRLTNRDLRVLLREAA